MYFFLFETPKIDIFITLEDCERSENKKKRKKDFLFQKYKEKRIKFKFIKIIGI